MNISKLGVVSSRAVLYAAVLSSTACASTPSKPGGKLTPSAKATPGESPNVTLGKPTVVINGVATTRSFSHTSVRNISSTLFDNAKVELGGPAAPLSESWTAELSYPVQSETKEEFETRYSGDLRWFVSKTKESGAVLSGTVGGQPFRFTSPNGRVIAGDDMTRTVKGKLRLKSGGLLKIKLELMGSRPSKRDMTLMALDSLDLSFGKRP